MGSGRNELDVDVLIIGAGPAGLAAAAGLQDAAADVLIVDQGPPLGERDATNPEHLTTGVGGAGLFSDGKFSFRPSATRLWSLEPAGDLRAGYAQMAEALSGTSLRVPELFLDGPSPGESVTDGTGFQRKPYPSFYASVEERTEITERLSTVGRRNRFLSRTRATTTTRSPDGRLATVLEPSGSGGDVRIVRSRALVLAGGRFGPLSHPLRVPGFSYIFRRLEIGVRIEQPAGEFFLRTDPALDPKLTLDHESGRYSWRTFCCCRNGKVIGTRFNGLTTLSGRADCPPTGRSNVGFNLRVTDARDADRLWREVLPRVRTHSDASARSCSWVSPEPLDRVLDRRYLCSGSALGVQLGEPATRLLCDGLRRLRESVGDPMSSATVSGPTVEGVGRYPLVAADLKVTGLPIWVAGDSSGLFRGITAALVSGFFTARGIERHLRRLPCH